MYFLKYFVVNEKVFYLYYNITVLVINKYCYQFMIFILHVLTKVYYYYVLLSFNKLFLQTNSLVIGYGY